MSLHELYDNRLAACIEWARGFVLEQMLYRGLVFGWLSKLDDAFEDFYAVASAEPCQATQFAWVVGEAHMALGHTLAKYESAGETRAEILTCVKVRV